MKKLLTTNLVISLFFLMSCTQIQTQFPFEALKSQNVPHGLVRQIVEDNQLIAVDVSLLQRSLDYQSNTRSTSVVDPLQVAQMKAALFRFYSHVEIVDGRFQFNGNPERLNISEQLFQLLMDGLNQMNSYIEQFGDDLELPDINEYLEFLLGPERR